jgi:hypothetical protein
MSAKKEAKPPSPGQIRAAVERFLRASNLDEQREAYGKILIGLSSRLPHEVEEATQRDGAPKPPDPSELPVDRERADRANRHMEEAYYVIEALRELGADPQNFDVNSAPTIVEHMAIRAQTLVLAGMCALDNPTIADEPSEFLTEYERYERRRKGEPEQEPEAEEVQS